MKQVKESFYEAPHCKKRERQMELEFTMLELILAIEHQRQAIVATEAFIEECTEQDKPLIAKSQMILLYFQNEAKKQMQATKSSMTGGKGVYYC